MRKRGEYIIDVRLQFKRGFQREFLKSIAKQSGKSWAYLAKKIGVDRHTIGSDWYKEKTTLPKSKALELLELYPSENPKKILREGVIQELPPKWGQIKSGAISLKPINEPKPSEDLAEFIGLLIGDGHINKKGIRITGNSFEISHHYYIKRLIKKLFMVDARVFICNTQKSVCITNVYSKNLVEFLEGMSLKRGDKIKNKTRIPKWILEDNKFAYGALRGLFDTDGGIYLKQKKYGRAFIEFQNHCPETMKDITLLIRTAGFVPSKSSINVRIQEQKDIKKFFELVGSSNPKNIIRYLEFLNIRSIPLKEELTDKILKYRGSQPFKVQS